LLLITRRRRRRRRRRRGASLLFLLLKCAHLSLLFLKHEEEAAQFKEQRAKLRAFVRANSALFCFERKRENAESSRKREFCSRFSQTTALLFNEEEDGRKIEEEGRRVNANYALPNTLISLSTDRESSILRVVLLSYKQTDTTKGFKEDKEEHETITRMMTMRSEGTRVIPLSKNGTSQLHPRSHPHPRRVIMGIKKSTRLAPRGASSSPSLKKNESHDASSEPDVLIVQSKNKRIMYSTTREINVQEVSDLCDKVGWPKRPEEKLKIALENSFLVAQMYVCSSSNNSNNNNKEEEEEEKLIATCRATSDHAFNACLWDIIVDPEYQGQGLGKAIVSHSIRALLARDVANVTLFADKDVVEFYERLGFVTDADGVKGMFLYPNVEGE
jgi:hypothetical protein